MKTATLISLLAAAPALPLAAQDRPYAGQEKRTIASLSSAEVDDLLAGRGAGYASTAELNGWPGPVHVLELADDLELTDAQRQQVESIYQQMRGQARTLGADFVAAEAALDAAFQSGDVTADTLADLTIEAAGVEAELRAVHLAAHIATSPLLSRQQKITYARLRGYSSENGHDH